MTTPLTTAEYASLRERIVAANPQVARQGCDKCGTNYVDGTRCVYCTGFRIGIADVLLAIEEHCVCIYSTGYFFLEDQMTDAQWNLGKDSFDDQSPETQRFLYDLLLPQ